MKVCTTSEIRQAFLDYFERQGHTVVPSSSVIPHNDPTLFFTNAGMVQFKDVFLGVEKRKYTRAVTVQRCMRASGKHNDLENVGYTTRHHTFFEMLGNFSFGDYFKADAIHYAWEFLTKELGINSQKLWITVHEKDKEAEALWQEEFKKTNSQPQGLSYCGDKDNFWAMGETGPCGYCSEIFYDHGEHLHGGTPGSDNDGERYVEIWNLVFMQFERDANGSLVPLPKPSIDTGMGLERIAAVMQGVHDNYFIDIFVELYNKFIGSLKTKFGIKTEILNSEEARIASRVLADHIRAAVFLIAEGVVPSNEKTGYVLRSIIRRAIYYLYRLGIRQPFFFQLVQPLVGIFGNVYPEVQLEKSQIHIASIIEQEEIKFLDTLHRGLRILENEISKLQGDIIPGEVAFNLHDTYGLPIILTAEIARKRGLGLDQVGFEVAMERQREMSRAAGKIVFAETIKLSLDGNTEFVGYTQNSCTTKVSGLFKQDGLPAEKLSLGEEGIVILKKTPFYAESGGQVGDSGQINSDLGIFVVHDTKKHGALYLHYGCMIKGSLLASATVNAEIDSRRRQALRLNHSATHLLHQGLHLVLGEHATQRGSLVDSKRLRFDFAHSVALSAEELRELERVVNANIQANLEVSTTIKTLEEAKSDGVVALFGEKYGEEVRVVTMKGISKELCGGTHVNYTGEIGLFKIVSEAGIAAGMRRIEAVTGENALNLVDKTEAELKKVSQILGVGLEQVVDKIQQILGEQEVQAKQLLQLQREVMCGKCKELISQAVNVDGVSVLSLELPGVDGQILRQMTDLLKQQLHIAVVVLTTISADNKIQLVVGVTQDLIGKIKANELLQYIVKQVDGSGGGRADIAQGGGTKVEALRGALDSIFPWIKNIL